MNYTQILLLINSLLLAIISALFFIAGYFLRDLHRDFKALIERVHKLYSDLSSHINWFDNVSKLFQKQVDAVEEKVKELEVKVSEIKNARPSDPKK